MSDVKVENWKVVEGYSSYMVSDKGRVYSNISCKLLSTYVVGGRYTQVKLYTGTKNTSLSVHRLVAKAFIPNPNDLPEINHIDEVKTNNHISNLEWCDRFHNAAHSFAKSFKIVDSTGKLYEDTNLSAFAREHTLNRAVIGLVVNGHQEHYKGWRHYKYEGTVYLNKAGKHYENNKLVY